MADIVEHVGPDGEVRRLPAGERVLWSGAPDARALARYFLRERWVLGFVAVSCALGVGDALQHGGAGMMPRLFGVTTLCVLLASIAFVSIRFFAWQLARSSKYVITDKRLYFNIGIVLRADANVPFSAVDGVDLLRRRDGSGDLMVTLSGTQEIPWLLLFPHMSWRGSRRGRPTFRGLRTPQPAADALVAALQAYPQSDTTGAATAAAVAAPARPPVNRVTPSPA